MSYELKNFKVLGYTTDFNKCECCGKEDLKGTVSILDLIGDIVLHFGSTCAANANKYDSIEAAKLAKQLIKDEIKAFEKAQKLYKLDCLNKAIQDARNEYQESEELKAYNKRISDSYDMDNSTYELHRAIVQENIRIGNIARDKKNEIILKYNLPDGFSYRLG